MNCSLGSFFTVAAALSALSLQPRLAFGSHLANVLDLRDEFQKSDPLEFSSASRFAKPMAPHLFVAGQADLGLLPRVTTLSNYIFDAYGLTTLLLGNLDGVSASPYTGIFMDSQGRSVANFLIDEHHSSETIRQSLQRSSRSISWSYRVLRAARAYNVTEGLASGEYFMVQEEVRYRGSKAILLKLHRLLAIGTARPIWRFREIGPVYEDVTPVLSEDLAETNYLRLDLVEDILSAPPINHLDKTEMGFQDAPHFWVRGTQDPAEVDSARDLAAVLHARFGVTTLAFGSENDLNLPGFDGLLLDDQGRAVANYSQKMLISGGATRFRQQIALSRRGIRDFSIPERWADFAFQSIGPRKLEEALDARSALIKKTRLLAVGTNRPVWTIVRAYGSSGLTSAEIVIENNALHVEGVNHQRIITLLDTELVIRDLDGTTVEARPDCHGMLLKKTLYLPRARVSE